MQPSTTFSRKTDCHSCLCLPIMPSERTDDEDRRAMRSMRYARLSAQVDEGEHPCLVQDACALRRSRAIFCQQMAQVTFAEHHDMIEALASDRSDQPFNMTVLPW